MAYANGFVSVLHVLKKRESGDKDTVLGGIVATVLVLDELRGLCQQCSQIC